MERNIKVYTSVAVHFSLGRIFDAQLFWQGMCCCRDNQVDLSTKQFVLFTSSAEELNSGGIEKQLQVAARRELNPELPDFKSRSPLGHAAYVSTVK